MSWLTWGATKLFLAKAWIWSKHHWKIIALVVWTIAIWFVSRKSSRAMLKVLQTSRKSYEDEVEVLNKLMQKSKRKKQQQLMNITSCLVLLKRNIKMKKIN